MKDLKVTYSYNDVSLVPAYSELTSRSQANPEMHGYKLPIIASCMDKLGHKLMEEVINSNIPFIAHRSFKSAKDQYEYFIPNFEKTTPFDRYNRIWFAVGSVQKYKDWIDYLYFGQHVRNFCVDMAHGDSKSCIDTINYIKSLRTNNDLTNKKVILDKKYFKSVPKESAEDKTHVIAGNVATIEGFKRLQKAGADGIRVGIASGSICFTPNTKVWFVSSSGKVYTKEIKHIEIGDKVLTASGHTRKVINKFINDYTGEIYKINDINATPNHKFHVFNNETREKEYIAIKDIDINIHSFIKIDGKTEKLDIDLDEYIGKVYNIEVDEQHTYAVGSAGLGVSNCSTALETGMGVPILTNIMEIAPYKKNTWLIADGGANHCGDIAKAIYFGADFVMMGKMLAATDLAEGFCYNKFQEKIGKTFEIYPHDDIATILKEQLQKDIDDGSITTEDIEYFEKTNESILVWGNNPKFIHLYRAIHNIVKYKQYNGMASREARTGLLNYASVEGRSGLIEYDCSTKQFIQDTYLRLQASLSYGGARNWSEFRKNVQAVRRSQAAISAGKTHLDILFDK